MSLEEHTLKHIFLDEKQRSTLLNALKAAEDIYSQDALDVENVPGHARLSEQFKRQAMQASAMYDMIEQASDIELVSDGLQRVA